jgi:hypothetical protein
MLRPKNSTESLDTLHHEQQQLSVTICHREELPCFSTERFFMLSEFHLNAHSIRFTSDLLQHDDGSFAMEKTDADKSVLVEELQHGTDGFPPFLILYVLWRSDMTTSADAFTSEFILSAVETMQSHVDLASSEEEKRKPPRGDVSTCPCDNTIETDNNNISNKDNSNNNNNNSNNNNTGREHDSVASSSPSSSPENRKTQLYLVVERTVPFDDDNHAADSITNKMALVEAKRQETNHFEAQTKIAECLAKHIASHSRLRSLFQGITIGVANHKRAAPGLDACLNAINFGARDRRRYSKSARCNIGLICRAPADLLGLDKDGETDGAQNVLQTRISTEWNGKGNLKSFSYRAHARWCKDYGMPLNPPDFPLQEGIKRRNSRLGRLDEELERLDASPLDLLLNVGAFLLILYYIWKAFVGELS